MFFNGVGIPASSTDGRKPMIASLFIIFQEFDRLLPAHAWQEQFERCWKRGRSWDKANKVSLDAPKEHMIGLPPSESTGGICQALITKVGVGLRMNAVMKKKTRRTGQRTRPFRGHIGIIDSLN